MSSEAIDILMLLRRPVFFADIVCLGLKLSGRDMSDFAIHPMAAIFGDAAPAMLAAKR